MKWDVLIIRIVHNTSRFCAIYYFILEIKIFFMYRKTCWLI